MEERIRIDLDEVSEGALRGVVVNASSVWCGRRIWVVAPVIDQECSTGAVEEEHSGRGRGHCKVGSLHHDYCLFHNSMREEAY